MNKRSQAQLQGTSSGMTRKSAASAKPARAAASSVRVVASSGKAKRKQLERGEDLSGLSREEKRARKQQRRLEEDRIFTAANALMKENEDYNRYRRMWWFILSIGIACIIVTWVLMTVMSQNGTNQTMGIVQIVLVVASYACILGALAFDLIKIRPIRNQCRSVAESMSDAKLNAVIERASAAEDKKQAEREARKAAKKAAKK